MRDRLVKKVRCTNESSLVFDDGRQVYSEYDKEYSRDIRRIKINGTIQEVDFGSVKLGPTEYFCKHPDGSIKRTTLVAELMRQTPKKTILGNLVRRILSAFGIEGDG